jgi:hypothetical protein
MFTGWGMKPQASHSAAAMQMLCALTALTLQPLPKRFRRQKPPRSPKRASASDRIENALSQILLSTRIATNPNQMRGT